MNRNNMGWVVAAALAVALVGVLVFQGSGDEGTRPGALGPAGDSLQGLLPPGAAEDAARLLDEKATEGENALPELAPGQQAPRLESNPSPICDPSLPPNVSADWLNQPEDLDEAAELADLIVVGTVQSVAEGPDYVVKAPGEPGGQLVTPVQRISVTVRDVVKGSGQAGQVVDVERLGDGEGCYRVMGDPPYQQGEQYLLLLKVREQAGALLQPVSPVSGRFEVVDGRLRAMPHNHIPFIGEIENQSLDRVVARLRG